MKTRVVERSASSAVEALLCSPPFGVRNDPTSSNEGILFILNKLSEQQDSFAQSQHRMLQKIEQKEVGFRRWIEFFVTQKEGELLMQLEQNHVEMMKCVDQALMKRRKPGDQSRQAEIMQRHHLKSDQPRDPLRVSFPVATTFGAVEVEDEKQAVKENPKEKDFSNVGSMKDRATKIFDQKAVSLKNVRLPKTWPNVRDSVRKKKRTSKYDPEEEIDDTDTKPRFLKRLVRNMVFESVMCVMICANLIGMFICADFRSSHTAYELGLHDDDSTWKTANQAFDVAEYIFCSIFAAELAIRLAALGFDYLRYPMNMVDALVVVITSLETYVFTATGLSSVDSNISLMRLLRLTRVLRVTKLIRFAQSFAALRVLVRTLHSSFQALILSMLLLSFIIMSGGVLITESLATYMQNKSESYDDRHWAFEHFGSASKATQRLFDATFSFSWVEDSRRMITRIGGQFAIFWIFWTVVINFTVMRVIGAIFLKQTLAIATEDAERMELQRMEQKETYADELRAIFTKADLSGDGMVSSEEFLAFIHNSDVADAFIKLDLELIEVVSLFRLLADEDGKADYEEFLQGALKLKSSASTIDAIQILHASKTLEDQIGGLAELIVEACDSGAFEPGPTNEDGGHSEFVGNMDSYT